MLILRIGYKHHVRLLQPHSAFIIKATRRLLHYAVDSINGGLRYHDDYNNMCCCVRQVRRSKLDYLWRCSCCLILLPDLYYNKAAGG
ncbi:hypothetical protein O9993_23125 [Vibrio lentus]|nr:hypothetical protein [Vibrio lentus]